MKNNFRILSLDGGGLRGIVPVLILQEIERRSGKRINDLFDLISGTSTGGLIACGVTVSEDGLNPIYTLKDLENIYVERGDDIFPKKTLAGKIFNSISSLRSPRFSDNGIEEVLTEFFGTKRMSSCITPILVTSFDLFNNEALFFKSRHAISRASRNALLKDICRATSAAPTYLPAYKFNFDNKTRVCVDGGVYINNPAVASLVEITKYHKERPYEMESVTLQNIQLLSLGTGEYSADIARKKVEGWGLLNWATSITDVMMQAVNQTTTYMADELTKSGNFLRINLNIRERKYSDMADSSDETRDYLIAEVKSQILGNDIMMRQLDILIEKLLKG